MAEPQRNRDLGELAVQRGLISRSQLAEALTDLTARLEQSENPSSDTLTLITVLLSKGWLQPDQVSELLRQQLPPDEPARPAGDLPAEVEQAMRFPDSRFAKYTIVRLLGTGGMGAVYMAWDNELRRFIALKFLTVGTEENIRRFIREAQTAARLNHPNIAQVYDAGSHDNRHFIAMEYVDGLTLDTLPEGVRRGEIDKIVRIMRDVAQAVDYAHSKGIIHRDLKPQNVMIDDLLKPRIMDFGLARAVTTEELRTRQADPARKITVSGTIVGTPNFVAPEQARGDNDRLDPRTDVYALGATLFALVTGVPPFNANTPLDTIMEVLQREPPRPSASNAAVSRDLETVILKCLEKEPVYRYQNAREVADELQRILSGEPVQARSASLAEMIHRLVRRRPTATSILVSAVLLVSMALFFVSRELLERVERDALEATQRAEETRQRQEQIRLERAQNLVEEARPLVERADRMLHLPGFSRRAFVDAVNEALAALTRAVESHGSYAPALLLRAKVHALAGDLGRAIEDADHAAACDVPTARPVRGLLRLKRALRDRRAPRMLALLGSPASWSAIRPLRETRADFDGAADDFAAVRSEFADGARAFARGDAAAALVHLGRAVERDPQDADVRLIAAAAHLARGDAAAAGAALEAAIRVRPNDAEARAWHALVLRRLGRADDAVAEARAALEIAPDHPDLLVLAGDLDTAVARRPKDAVPLAWRGMERLRAVRTHEALTDFESGARLLPEGVEVLHALRSRAALALGRTDVAEQAGLEAVRCNPDYGPAHAALAAARWARGARGAARESLDVALKLDAADADVQELLGAMEHAAGRKREAVEAWNRAIELDPQRKGRLQPLVDRAGD